MNLADKMEKVGFANSVMPSGFALVQEARVAYFVIIRPIPYDTGWTGDDNQRVSVFMNGGLGDDRRVEFECSIKDILEDRYDWESTYVLGEPQENSDWAEDNNQAEK